MEGLRILLEARADPHVKDAWMMDALAVAVSESSFNAVDYMLSTVTL